MQFLYYLVVLLSYCPDSLGSLQVGDLNYRLTLPPYMKTHPIFYVGRLKRYVDPEVITYPHQSNETDGDADCESSVATDQATRKPRGSPCMNEAIEDSVIE